MNLSPLVSVMVVNYNGTQYLKDCFESIFAGDYENIEVIMIDNYSTDDSVAYVEQHFPRVKIVQTWRNAGYSRAYNIGFSHGQGKYFVLLNNDVIVEKNWLSPLVAKAESDDAIGALQPKIVSQLEKGYFEYAGASGGMIDYLGYPFLRGRLFFTVEKDEGQYDDDARIFWASGAALFIRAAVLSKTGPLDEHFVHHMEEIDLCWRINLAGYKIMVVPESKINHYEGATIKPFSFKKLYWNHRNNIFMLYKNLDPSDLIGVLTKRVLLDKINIFYAVFARLNLTHAWAIIRAYLWLFAHIGLLRQSRRDVQAQKSLSNKDIRFLFYPRSIILRYFVGGKKTYKELQALIKA
jgi:GT2 family glycosyltransferase